MNSSRILLGSDLSTTLKLRLIRIFAVALLLSVAVAIAEGPQGASCASPAPAGRVFGEKRPVGGVSNFGQVTPTLFRGAQPTQQGFEALTKMGVDIVVDAREDHTASEEKEVSRLGMKYVSIPWHCPSPHDDVFVQFLKVLQQSPGKKVFVHCRLGDDRTGMMIASYRMAVQGWSASDAMLEMQHFGFTFAHHFMCPSLAHYEQSFPNHLKSNPAFKDLRSAPSSPANIPK